MNVIPPEEVEYLLSHEAMTTDLPRRDDDDDHNPHKDEWDDAVHFFNDVRR